MLYRKRARKRVDRKMFSRTASSVHPKNVGVSPMRGGYRF